MCILNQYAGTEKEMEGMNTDFQWYPRAWFQIFIEPQLYSWSWLWFILVLLFQLEWGLVGKEGRGKGETLEEGEKDWCMIRHLRVSTMLWILKKKRLFCTILVHLELCATGGGEFKVKLHKIIYDIFKKFININSKRQK